MKNLSDNQPVADFNEYNDLFNLYPKANSIKDFIINYYSEADFLNNKILAIYGNWGSGKTTIMKYLNNELSNNEGFIPVFFEAWKYEKDNNLSFSLIDVMVNSNNIRDNKAILKTAYSLFKIIGSGVSVNFPTISFNVGNVLDKMDKELEKNASSLSYYRKIESFKASFEELENKVLGREDDFQTIKDGKKIIVFIDDLDRCDPEKALDLLSDIKHFFTLGKRTIFVVGIDQQAINCAIKAKYQNYLNSEEYLEKIFDFTFDIAGVSNPSSYIMKYFRDKFDIELNNHIMNLFTNLGFTTPRHVKKVLNKFTILETFVESNSRYKALIPDISKSNDRRYHLNVILIIYFIILYEFYPKKFKEISDFNRKLSSYIEGIQSYVKSENRGENTQGITLNKKNSDAQRIMYSAKLKIEERSYTLKNISQLFKQRKDSNDDKGRILPAESYDQLFIGLFLIFTPHTNNFYIENPNTEKVNDFLSQFKNPDDEVLTRFCKYLRDHADLILENDTDYSIWKLFEMCRILL